MYLNMSVSMKKSPSRSFSIRLRSDAIRHLSRQAKRQGQPARTLAQRYIEEGLRHEEHPLVHFVDGPAGRRASMLGCGLDVWEIVETVRDNDGSVEGAADYLGKPIYLIQAALQYYTVFPDEIDAWIGDHHEESERLYAEWTKANETLKR